MPPSVGIVLLTVKDANPPVQGPRLPMVLFRLCELLREVAPDLSLPSAAQVPHGTLSTLHAACIEIMR